MPEHGDTPQGDSDTRETLGDGGFSQDEPLEGLSSVSLESTERPGTVIGNYKLLEQIGEGGFGVVYLAEQERPVRRRVALKILKLGMDTKRVIGRFEAERQALAMMDHPCIAKVLDAGATGTGRPFFVMELVRGVPLTDYCDRNNLSTVERLRLFIDVCHAVQHAHQKGVIHRDLKPSNILVGVQDNKAQPKVIDFGIAKATTQPLTEQTVYTMQRQLIGTPEYMSPEQAEMTGLDIDTRSDIYSLGVILYELLTGATPFDAMTLRSASFHELPRLLREKDPPIPSTRLASLGDQAEVVARHHREQLSQLTRSIRGDLDWITMKAMEKDRTRRYDTANALAADIERHLKNEPVLASPPSTVYRFQKFARRNRALLGAMSAVAAALVVGLGAATYGFITASLERDQKEAARAQAVLALDREAAARQESDAVTSFLADMLSAVDPAQAGRDVMVQELLDQAALGLETEFTGRPRIEARLRQTIGDTYVALGAYTKAERQLPAAADLLRSELGEEAPDTLRSMASIAELRLRQGRYAEAEAILLQTLDAARRILGDEHPDTLGVMHRLAVALQYADQFEKSQERFKEALDGRRRVLGEEHRDTMRTATALALLHTIRAQYEQAEPIYLDMLARQQRILGSAHPDTLTTRKNLAVMYRAQGRFADAEPLYNETLAIQRRVLGEKHPETLRTLNNLAVLALDQRRHEVAEPLFLQALEISREVLGPSHPETARVMANLAQVYTVARRYDEAEALHRETLAIRERELGEEHTDTLSSAAGLAGALRRLGRADEAETLLAQTLRIRRRVLDNEHPTILSTMSALGAVYKDMGRLTDAERMFVETLSIQRRVQGSTHPNTLGLMINLGALYVDMERREDAATIYAEALSACRETLGPRHSYTAAARNNLYGVLRQLERWADAEPLLAEIYEQQRESLGPGHAQTIRTLGDLASLRMTAGMVDAAREATRTLIETRTTLLAGDDAPAEALVEFAYFLLVCEPEDLRDPVAAAAHARRACELNGRKEPMALQVLAMALHACDDHEGAVEAQLTAIELLRDDPEALSDARTRLNEYESANNR